MVPKHVVMPGETLWGIAQRYDLLVDELKLTNLTQNLENLQPGTVLYLPMSFGGHQVKRGETLSGIASMHGLTFAQLMVYNAGIADPNYASPGYEVRIPRFQFGTYTVKPGESWYTIASKYGMPFQELVALNVFSALEDPRMRTWLDLYPGKKLAVPVTREDYMPRADGFMQPYGMYYPMVMFPVRVMRNR